MASESSNGAAPARNDRDNRSPFERFEDLTKTILKVPKAEVEARRAKIKRRARRA